MWMWAMRARLGDSAIKATEEVIKETEREREDTETAGPEDGREPPSVRER